MKFISLIIIAAVFSFGCARVPRLSDYKMEGVQLEGAARLEFERGLAQHQSAFNSLKILSRCAVTRGEEGFTSRYAYVARSSGELRIEQFPMSGFYSLSALTNNGESTTIVFQNEQRAVLADNGAQGLAELFGIDIELAERDVGELLAGNVPARLLKEHYEVRQIGAEYALRSASFLAFLGRGFESKEFHLFNESSEREIFSISYKYDGAELPRSFELKFPEYEVIFVCEATQRAFNKTVKDEVFRLDVPQSFEIEDRRRL